MLDACAGLVYLYNGNTFAVDTQARMCAVMAGGCTHIKTFVFGDRPAGHYCTDRMTEMQEKIPLASLTTLRAGGPARYFFIARTKEDIMQAAGFASAQNLPVLILGGGSNMLVSDKGFPGVVIKNEIMGTVYEEVGNGKVRAIVGGGVEWDGFVADTVERRFYGLENLSLIPGTVGAAPVQNIGAYGVEAERCIEWVEVFNLKTGEERKLLHNECAFAYRSSVFKKAEGKNYVIARVCFLLDITGALNVAYKDVEEYFAKNGISDATLKDVRNAIIVIRTNKLPNVKVIGTAGSFFKNPIVSLKEKDVLLARYPALVWYSHDKERIKLSAAWLIEHIGGWKGKREGGVGVYERHSLTLVNYAKSNAQEVFSFARKIQEDIKRKTGVSLEFEVNCIGEFEK